MAAHDLETRVKQARKFLENGHKIRCELILQGREMIHTRRAYLQLTDFLHKLEDISTLTQPIVRKGSRVTVGVQPSNKSVKNTYGENMESS